MFMLPLPKSIQSSRATLDRGLTADITTDITADVAALRVSISEASHGSQ